MRTLSQNCEQTLQKSRTNRIMNKRAFLINWTNLQRTPKIQHTSNCENCPNYFVHRTCATSLGLHPFRKMRWYNFDWHCTGCFGFPSNMRPCCADPCPDLLSFVLCCLVFQQFRMVMSKCDRQKAEVCACVSYMYFTFSQDMRAIRLTPCCGPRKRYESFMIWQPHHAIRWNFPSETLFYHFSMYIKQQGHDALKKSRLLTLTELTHFHALNLWNSSAFKVISQAMS